MTYYYQQVLFLRKNYPKDHLCEQVIQAKKFIDNNFDCSISLQDIAGKAYCSKFHFLRLFKSLYGRTPHQYLTSVRIEKAKELLQSGLPVSDVCFSVGFDSVSSFKALFKRNTAFTPSIWQRRLRSRQAISATPFRFLPFFFTLEKSNIQDS